MRGIVLTTDGMQYTDALELRGPARDEVIVRITAAGVCHSDLKFSTMAPTLTHPTVMGHEGTGVIEEVGAGVSGVGPGDTVVTHTMRYCGRCDKCSIGRPGLCRQSLGHSDMPFTLNGEPVLNFANTSVFTDHTVLHQNQVVRVDPAIPAGCRALLGCGVLTGAGAVFNRAKVAAGDTVAIFGVGGIGLNVIQAAAIAGASRIIAVDTNPTKESIGRTFGATDFVSATGQDAVDTVLGLMPYGVNHSFVCIGIADLVPVAAVVLDWGGQCVIIGFPPAGAFAQFHMQRMYNDKSILTCRYGTSRPQRDIPFLADLYQRGILKLDELVSDTVELHDAPAALETMHAGRVEAGTILSINAE